jgi:hypothetical protein
VERGCGDVGLGRAAGDLAGEEQVCQLGRVVGGGAGVAALGEVQVVDVDPVAAVGDELVMTT